MSTPPTIGLSDQLLSDLRGARDLAVEGFALSHAAWLAEGGRLSDARDLLVSVGIAPSALPLVAYGAPLPPPATVTVADTPTAQTPSRPKRPHGEGYRRCGLPILRLIAAGQARTGQLIKGLAAESLVPADDRQYTSQIAGKLLARGLVSRLQEGLYALTPAGHAALKAGALPPFGGQAGGDL